TIPQTSKLPRLTKSTVCLAVRIRLVPHLVAATCRSRAATNMRADWPSGKAPTTLVRRRISRISRSNGLLVLKPRIADVVEDMRVRFQDKLIIPEPGDSDIDEELILNQRSKNKAFLADNCIFLIMDHSTNR